MSHDIVEYDQPAELAISRETRDEISRAVLIFDVHGSDIQERVFGGAEMDFPHLVVALNLVVQKWDENEATEFAEVSE